MTDNNRDVKMEIVHSFISEFNKKGHKATLDEVSSNIHISKKTIYKYFSGKRRTSIPLSFPPPANTSMMPRLPSITTIASVPLRSFVSSSPSRHRSKTNSI